MVVRESHKISRYASRVYTSYPSSLHVGSVENRWDPLWPSLANSTAYRVDRSKAVDRVGALNHEGKIASSNESPKICVNLAVYSIRSSVSARLPDPPKSEAIRVVRKWASGYRVVDKSSADSSIV